MAQIITFNTMAAKAAIKDVGRALDMPYGEVDRIAKLVPATIGMTIDQGAEGVAAAAGGIQRDAADQRADRHGKKAGGDGAQSGRACRRRGDLAGAAD